MRERDVIRPVSGIVASREKVGQFQAGPLAQRDQVDGLAPRRALLGTPSCRHLPDYAGQYIGRMFPADDVETFESLVDEIERVPAIGIGAVRLGREEEICEF